LGIAARALHQTDEEIYIHKNMQSMPETPFIYPRKQYHRKDFVPIQRFHPKSPSRTQSYTIFTPCFQEAAIKTQAWQPLT